jgi:hypothetical protein
MPAQAGETPGASRIAPRTRSALAPAMALALALAALSAVTSADADQLEPYQATYNGIWHGMTVAISNLRLDHTGDTWTYSARSEPRGIGRLAAGVFPPAQVSVVRVSGSEVQPQSYKSTGGSHAKNTELTYDWQAKRVTGTYEGTPVDLPLTPQMQDEASVQLALMVALLAGHPPSTFQLIDRNAVREYQFAADGEANLPTPMGEIHTVVYRSQKANSRRITRFWCAPERGYIPLKVQQTIGDDVQWTLQVQSLTRG